MIYQLKSIILDTIWPKNGNTFQFNFILNLMESSFTSISMYGSWKCKHYSNNFGIKDAFFIILTFYLIRFREDPEFILFLLIDALAGHDVRDSTTVTDPFQNFSLPDDISVKHLHIGIPKVRLPLLSLVKTRGVTVLRLLKWFIKQFLLNLIFRKWIVCISHPNTLYSRLLIWTLVPFRENWQLITKIKKKFWKA